MVLLGAVFIYTIIISVTKSDSRVGKFVSLVQKNKAEASYEYFSLAQKSSLTPTKWKSNLEVISEKIGDNKFKKRVTASGDPLFEYYDVTDGTKTYTLSLALTKDSGVYKINSLQFDESNPTTDDFVEVSNSSN